MFKDLIAGHARELVNNQGKCLLFCDELKKKENKFECETPIFSRQPAHNFVKIENINFLSMSKFLQNLRGICET